MTNFSFHVYRAGEAMRDERYLSNRLLPRVAEGDDDIMA